MLYSYSVVTVNGLNGDPTTTWKTDGRGKLGIWIQDLLPLFVKNIRVLAYQYNSSSFETENLFAPG